MSKLQARNEMIINAPISKIWAIITDIDMLVKTNPGVIKATGSMNSLGSIRKCEIDNKGKIGTMTENMIECLPEQKTTWTIVEDSMGMSKMLKDTRFCFYLEKMSDNQTKVVNETYYKPANFIASIMSALMMKKIIRNAQQTILNNIKSLTEK